MDIIYECNPLIISTLGTFGDTKSDENWEKFQKGGSHFQSKTYIADFDLPQGFKQGYWENFAIEVSENEGGGGQRTLVIFPNHLFW